MSISKDQTSAGRKARPGEGAQQAGELNQVKVWDIAVRVFHWSLVSLFVIAWLSADEWDKLHEYAGYIIGALIAFRIVWGLVGTKHARFTDFVYSPLTILRYLRDIVSHRAKRYIGHNPAGGAMVLALLFLLTIITASGYAMTTNTFWGVDWVEDLHEASAYAILAFILFHVIGVIHAGFAHRENLVRSMFTGRKRGE